MSLLAGQELLAADLAVTTGVWTPNVSWALPGAWSGVWRKQLGLVVATASITLTGDATAWPTTPAGDVFSVTGMPNPGLFVGGGCNISWGNRSDAAYLAGATGYVNLANKTASLPPAGSNIAVTLSYYAG